MSDNKPFAALKKLKVKDKKKAKPEPKPAPQPVPRADSEEDLFRNAMSGVTPIAGAGRDIQLNAPRPAPPVEDPDAEAAEHLRRLVNGGLEFDMEYTDEFMRGNVRGLDATLFNRLKAGTISHEAHIDLHGLTMEAAYDAVLFFIRESFMQGKRCVLLIPGRGKNSPGGQGIIRQELQHWLTRDPLKRVVLAFCTAQPRHGGAGALYVLLRKQKKSGKIKWERGDFWNEDD
jgi:DNA-nicking Smr family endonuclease